MKRITEINKGAAITFEFTYPVKSSRIRASIALVMPQVGQGKPIIAFIGQVIENALHIQ